MLTESLFLTEVFPLMCRDCGYIKTLLILPTTVLEQTMNNMKQCIMKSTLVIIFAVMKSLGQLFLSSRNA